MTLFRRELHKLSQIIFAVNKEITGFFCHTFHGFLIKRVPLLRRGVGVRSYFLPRITQTFTNYICSKQRNNRVFCHTFHGFLIKRVPLHRRGVGVRFYFLATPARMTLFRRGLHRFPRIIFIVNKQIK